MPPESPPSLTPASLQLFLRERTAVGPVQESAATDLAIAKSWRHR